MSSATFSSRLPGGAAGPKDSRFKRQAGAGGSRGGPSNAAGDQAGNAKQQSATEDATVDAGPMLSAAPTADACEAGGGGGGRKSRVVDFIVEGAAVGAAQPVDVGRLHSFAELWCALANALPGTLPDKLDCKLIYMDGEGDWLLVTPDEHWGAFAASVTKILVSSN
ncbi:hypothetical protein FOA52_008184 [Chlamydomonas sp. UWO 241]|nr:hypothetical protein FOA52_008184 [Chlamydomonas sp. UWO 241]